MNDNFRQGMYALVVVVLAAWFVGWAGGHDAHRGDDLPPDVAAAVEELRDGKVGVEPAEPLKELKPGMSWEVTGAGDATYNGTYSESGTYNGYPAYTNGSRWLWYDTLAGNIWVMSQNKGDISSDYYNGASLPGSWSVGLGTAPAPMVAEYVEPPTPPDPNDTTTKRTGWIPGPLSPTLFPCQTVKPARFVGTDANEYVAFVGRTRLMDSTPPTVVLYCVNTDTWMALRGQKFATAPFYNDHWYAPQTCLLHAGDGETLWFVDRSSVRDEILGQSTNHLLAYPLTLDIANLTYSVGSLFAPGIVMGTDIAVDDANTAWFMTFDSKLYSWDLTGTAVSLVKDWSTGRTEHGRQPGPRFWYSGTAGTFYRTHNPYYGQRPDYIHRVSSSVYEYMGESVPFACVSYDHDGPRDLTYGIAHDHAGPRDLTGEPFWFAVGTHISTWRYRPGAGDAWQGATLCERLDHVWVIRGTPMLVAGVNDTVLI